MAFLLELLKYTLPSLISLGGVYFIFSKYLNAQFNLQRLEMNKKVLDSTLPLRLQAYERLSLYCERIRIEQLMFRLHVPQGSAEELRSALLLTIQSEYEHNITQQLYVSASLWQIITTARDIVRQTVIDVAATLPATATNKDLELALLSALSERNLEAADVALQAIRAEAAGLMEGK